MGGKIPFKKLLIAVGVIVVVVIIAVGVLLSNLSSVAQKATEKALSHVLQVQVSVGGMKVSLSEGAVEINQLVIGNPEGFKTAQAVALQRIRVQADLKSFTTDQPVVKEISVEGAEVTLEQGLTSSNLSTLARSASRFSGASAETPAKEGEEAEATKNIVVDRLVLEGGRVAVSAPALQGKDVSFPLPRIEKEGIGRGGEKVTVAEAIQIFISEILKGAMKAGGGLIPEDFSQMLGGTLGAAGDTGQALGESLQKTGEGVGDSLKGAAEGLGGLFKKKENSTEN